MHHASGPKMGLKAKTNNVQHHPKAKAKLPMLADLKVKEHHASGTIIHPKVKLKVKEHHAKMKNHNVKNLFKKWVHAILK